MSKFKGQITLLIAAIIWGSSFIFQKMGMDFMSPFTFGFYRFFPGLTGITSSDLDIQQIQQTQTYRRTHRNHIMD